MEDSEIVLKFIELDQVFKKHDWDVTMCAAGFFLHAPSGEHFTLADMNSLEAAALMLEHLEGAK